MIASLSVIKNYCSLLPRTEQSFNTQGYKRMARSAAGYGHMFCALPARLPQRARRI